jgi:O-antigen ligase
MVWIGGVPIFGRFLNQDVTTFNGRTLLWQALLDHFDPKQILGHGLNASSQLLVDLRVSLNGGLIATSPSNLFLGTLYDHGIIGLGLLVVMLVALLISVVKGILRARGEQRMLFVVALVILVSVFLQSFEQDDLWTQAIGVYFWVTMALPFSRCWDSEEKVSDEDDDIGDRITDVQIEIPWWLRKREPTPDFTRSF